MDLKIHFFEKKLKFYQEFTPAETWFDFIHKNKISLFLLSSLIVLLPPSFIAFYFHKNLMSLGIFALSICTIFFGVIQVATHKFKKIQSEVAKKGDAKFNEWLKNKALTQEDSDFFLKCSLIFDILKMTEDVKKTELFEIFEVVQKAERDLYLIAQGKYDYFNHLVINLYSLIEDKKPHFLTQISHYEKLDNSELKDIYFSLLKDYVAVIYKKKTEPFVISQLKSGFDVKASKAQLNALNDDNMYESLKMKA